ncbi:MAG TPA: hypothetical protein VFG90_01920 [Nitrososphaeraceae archaeon]|nr:hypothetical protein [Nitrososphaeraceae archaeon]
MENHYNTNTNNLRYRRIQAIKGQKSCLLCIPLEFIADLKISQGDYVTCCVVDNQLIVEKA